MPVADPPLRSGSQKQKTTRFRPKYVPKCVICVLGIQNFQGGHAPSPDPLEHVRGYLCLLWRSKILEKNRRPPPPVCQFLDPPLCVTLLQHWTYTVCTYANPREAMLSLVPLMIQTLNISTNCPNKHTKQSMKCAHGIMLLSTEIPSPDYYFNKPMGREKCSVTYKHRFIIETAACG